MVLPGLTQKYVSPNVYSHLEHIFLILAAIRVSLSGP